MRSEAVSRYVIQVGTLDQANFIFGEHTYDEYRRVEDELKTVYLDIDGEYWDDGASIDDSLITVSLNEPRVEFDINAFLDRLPQYGYRAISVGGYCVGKILYSNVESEACSHQFVLDREYKNIVGNDGSILDADPITLQYVYGAPNRGITDEALRECVAEIVSRVEEG